MKKLFSDLFKIALWVFLVPAGSVTVGHHIGTERHKQHCVENGAATWEADKSGKVHFKFKGAENVGHAK